MNGYLAASYDPLLVLLSIFIAIVAAYAALGLGARVVGASARGAVYWIAGGAVAMGVGIWSMHFIGMLAFHLPLPLAYDMGITALSALPAVFASAVALYVLRRPRTGAGVVWLASLLMGGGIAAMHYTGMEAMRMSPPIRYQPGLLMLSIAIAVAASWVALRLSLQLRDPLSPRMQQRRLLRSVVMGLAIAGMHYTGMAAARFVPGSVCQALPSGLGANALALVVAGVALLVLLATLAVSFLDRLLGQNAFYRALLDAQSDVGEGVLLVEGEKVVFANRALSELTGYPREALLKRARFTDLVAQPDRAAMRELIDAALAGRAQAARREITLIRQDGTRRECEAAAAAFRHGEAIRFLIVLLDITDRKRTEAALRASEAEARQLALVASRTDNAVIITDAAGTILWVNDGFTRITGYAADEARGRKPGELLQGPETDPQTRKAIRARLDAGQGFEAEIVNYRKDGRKYWIAVNAQPVHDADGAIARFIAIERDVTERKQAEAALRESEARLREAQHLARIGSWSLDLARPDFLCSEEMYRLFEVGPNPGHLSRERFLESVDVRDRSVVQKIWAEADHSGAQVSTSYRLSMPDGRVKHVHERSDTIRDAAGRSVRRVGTIQDVTEQKEAEDRLRQLNETLEERVLERTRQLDTQREFTETILDTARSLVLVLDREGRVVRFNRACEELSGYAFDELRGRPVWDCLLPPERIGAVRAIFDERTLQNVPAVTESEWLTRAGQRRLIAWSNAAMADEDGRLDYLIATGIDITEARRAERALVDANESLQHTVTRLRETQHQLVQAEKMASLGSLVAGISHEINTPLGIGVTSATALQEEVHKLGRDFSDGSIRRSTLENFVSHATQGCEILVANLSRASELIRSFKQVAVDQSSDEWRLINLRDYVEEVLTSLRPKWKRSGVRVVNDCAPQLSIEVPPGAIYQVISNLVINALTYAFEPDRPGVITIAARREGDRICLDCVDDGKGMGPEIQARVFDPFFTTRRGSGGSGLGLHIVYNIVTGVLKGSIALDSAPGEGARFHVVFPAILEGRNQ